MSTTAEDVPARVNDELELLIHRLYAIMIQANNQEPTSTRKEHAAIMHKEIMGLVQNLKTFIASAQDLQIEIPMDVITYVEQGRNPDIYNREFVEAVQGLNQVMAGKTKAYAQFRDVLASQMKTGIPETKEMVDVVVRRSLGKVKP